MTFYAAKINTLNLSKLQNEQYIQLLTEFKKIIAEFGTEALKINKYFDKAFVVLYEFLLEAYKKTSKSAFTKRIHEADSKRDDAIYALINIVKANLRGIEEKTQFAAQRIMNRINSYKNLTSKKLDAQTTATNDLLDDLGKNYSEDALLLNLEKWVKYVKETNEEFERLMGERYKESRDKSDFTVSEVRKELDYVFKNLCSLIEVLAFTESEDIYPKFIKAVNVIFARYGSKRSANSSGFGEAIGGTEDEPTEPVEPEDPFANAREWKHSVKAGDFKLGDICYIAEPNVPKKYYELIDEEHYIYFPNSDEGTLAWKRLV